MMKNNGRHFVLVHGACHGGWCWYRLTALLKSAGHTVTAVDLAASGINTTKMEDLNSISDYIQPLMDLLDSLSDDDRIVLVAHSMGGVAASVAMENFFHKIRVAVFVTAFMPGPDLTVPQIEEGLFFSLPIDFEVEPSRCLSWYQWRGILRGAPCAHEAILPQPHVRCASAMEDFPDKIRVVVFVTAFMSGPDLTVPQIEEFNASILGPDYAKDFQSNNDTTPPSFFFGPLFTSLNMYQNSPPEDLELALMLLRPHPTFTDAKSMEKTLVTKEKYGSVPRVFIIAGEDRGLMVPLQMYMIERNPPNEVMEIADSDHMAMMSRPKELCSYLLDIAAKY